MDVISQPCFAAIARLQFILIEAFVAVLAEIEMLAGKHQNVLRCIIALLTCIRVNWHNL